MISHYTQRFSGYMRTVVDHFRAMPAPSRVLDIPAGAGMVTDALRALGHEVVPADINGLRPDYVRADMTLDLPFDDQSFDAVVCTEGIEHMLNPDHLLKELLRVCRVGGTVVISTPNVLCFYSRLQFLLTGTFHQFSPAQLREFRRDEPGDRFHIAPIDYNRLRYMAGFFGASVERVAGDRYKRKVLMPIYGVLWCLGRPWARSLFYGSRARREHADRNRAIDRDMNSAPVLFGRSLILFLRKNEHVPDMPETRAVTEAAEVASRVPRERGEQLLSRD